MPQHCDDGVRAVFSEEMMQGFLAGVNPDQELVNLVSDALREGDDVERARLLVAVANQALSMSDAALGYQGRIVTSLTLLRN